MRKTVKMTLDRYQGVTDNDRKFGYVMGNEGGYFFTWFDTLQETLESVDEDDQDGDGGLRRSDVVEFLRGKISSKFDQSSAD